MTPRKRLMRRMAQSKPAAVPYPLPEGKPEERNVFGALKRWNVQTGKYDLDA